MARRLKLKLMMSSFQFCRSKKPSFLDSIHMFSSINPKSFDIPYPGLFPVPPPSTPTRYPPHKQSDHETALKYEEEPFHKTYNSPVSDFSDDNIRPTIARSSGKRDGKQRVIKAKHRLSTGRSNCSSGESGMFSSEETESLFSSYSSSSPSFESFFDLDFPMRKQNSTVKKSVFERLMPCMVEGAVKDSVAVVKRSEDPYEDFKRSMGEMILEKEIFAVKDLEQLLLCFLSLNSQHHHAAIVEAFTEIWYELFNISPVPTTNQHLKFFL